MLDSQCNATMVTSLYKESTSSGAGAPYLLVDAVLPYTGEQLETVRGQSAAEVSGTFGAALSAW